MSAGRPPGRGRALGWAVAAAFAIFFGVSQVLPSARQLFPSNLPPLFVRWHPWVGPLVLLPLLLGFGLWLALPRLIRLSPVWFGLFLVLFTWLFAETLAAQAGGARTFNNCCVVRGYRASLTVALDRKEDYFQDVALVQRLGPRIFAARYPGMVRAGDPELSVHSGTHPPGASLLEWALWRLTGRSEVVVAALIALAGALGVLPAWAIARELYGVAAGRTAAVLFACTPGVLLYSATSADAIFMTLTGLAVVAVVRAPRSNAWAVASGPLAAVALCFTWGALALAPLGIGIALLSLRDHPPKTIFRRALLSVFGLVAGWLVIRALSGIDLLANFVPAFSRQVTFIAYHRSFWYWLPGNIVAFLFVMGVMNAGSFIATTLSAWRARRPGMETVLWVTLVLTSVSGVFKGETDHNWLFFMPLAIAVAAGVREQGRLRRVAAGGLGQAILTETLFYTAW